MGGGISAFGSGSGGGGSMPGVPSGRSVGPTTTEIIGERTRLTNLDTRADTWGKPIPRTWGVCRIGGAAIWSSKFYTTITDFKETTAFVSTSFNTLWNGIGDPIIRSEGVDVSTTQKAKTKIDIAYSFGEEGDSRARRVIRTMRINGTLVFDALAEYVFPGLGFNPRYGYEDGTIEATMAEYADTTGKYYYPDQTYVTLDGFDVAAWGNATPQSIDIEFGLDNVLSDPSVLDFNADFAEFPNFDSNQVYYSVSGRKIYVIYKADRKLRSFDIATGEFIEEKTLTGNLEAFSFLDEPNATNAQSHVPGLLVEALLLFPGANTSGVMIDCKTGACTKETFGIGSEGIVGSTGLAPIKDTATEAVFMVYAQIFYKGFHRIVINRGDAGLTTSFTKVLFQELYSFFNYRGSSQGEMAVVSSGEGLPTLVHRYGDAGFTQLNLSDERGTIQPVGAWRFETSTIVAYILNGLKFLGQWSDATNARVLEKQIPAEINIDTFAGQVNTNRQVPYSNSLVGLISVPDQKCYILNLRSLSVTGFPVLLPGLLTAWDGVRLQFVYKNNSPFDGSASLHGVIVFGQAAEMTLISFLESLYIESGVYTEAQITNVGIDDTIIGAVIYDRRGLTELVESVCALYRIEYEETSQGIRFFRSRDELGAINVKATIPVDELAMQQQGGSGQAALETYRQAEQEQAGEVTLTFIDPDNDYRENKVTARRVNASAAARKDNVSVPIVMRSETATDLVENLLNNTKASRITHKFRLPPKYNYLTKGDVIKIEHGIYTDTIRILQDDFNGDFSVSCEGESVATSIKIEIVTVPPIDRETSPGTAVVDSVPLVIDATTLVIEDDRGPGKFVQFDGMYPEEVGNWPGGYLARKSGNDQYGLLFNVGSVSAPLVMRASAVLTDKRWIVDNDPLAVTALSGKWLQSANLTVDEILADRKLNTAYYGKPGRWEVIQVASYTDGELSGIIRGLRGSEIYAGLHEVGDLIVLPTPGANLTLESRALTLEGTPDRYKAATEGQPFGNLADSDPVTVAGNSARPFAPAFVQAARDGAGVVTVTWERRDRLGTGWGADPLPLSEPGELYRVVIHDEDGNALRTLPDATAPQATYSAADQATDGVAAETTLYIRVIQIGELPGLSEVTTCPLT